MGIDVTVVGGGLAGMSAALRLRQLGANVELMEQQEDLGGEAAARVFEGRREDHGYHVFFPWYLNTNQLIKELGIRDNFVDCTAYRQLETDRYPDFSARWTPVSWDMLWQGIARGVLDVPHQVLYYFTLLDLFSQDYEAPGCDESVGAFMRRRWYATAPVKGEMDRLLATAVLDTDEYSARTLRRAMTGYARHGTPLCRRPTKNLNDAFIEPFRAQLEKLGVVVNCGWRAVGTHIESNAIEAIEFDTVDGAVRRPTENVVLAIPHHQVASLDDGYLGKCAGLWDRGLGKLRSGPLAALHLYFRERIPHLPEEHVNLVDSKYAISFIDVSGDGDRGTVLNLCILAAELSDAHPAEAARAVVEEMRRFIPSLSWDSVEHFVFQPHEDEPFFGNDVGSWEVRPDTSTELTNLWLAGDFVRSPVDLACMEGAVTTGLQAADAVRQASALSDVPVEIRGLVPIPGWQAVTAKTLLTPVAYMAYLATRLRSPRKASSREAV